MVQERNLNHKVERLERFNSSYFKGYLMGNKPALVIKTTVLYIEVSVSVFFELLIIHLAAGVEIGRSVVGSTVVVMMASVPHILPFFYECAL